jgi:hypothetical protein
MRSYPAPRSVQCGFTHRLRDGQNHIYWTKRLRRLISRVYFAC